MLAAGHTIWDFGHTDNTRVTTNFRSISAFHLLLTSFCLGDLAGLEPRFHSCDFNSLGNLEYWVTQIPFFFSSAFYTRFTPLPGWQKCSRSSVPCSGQLFLHPTCPSTARHSHTAAAGSLSPAVAGQKGEAWHSQVAQSSWTYLRVCKEDRRQMTKDD